MALPSSNISLSNIRSEFGGTGPISLGNYLNAHYNLSSFPISIGQFAGLYKMQLSNLQSAPYINIDCFTPSSDFTNPANTLPSIDTTNRRITFSRTSKYITQAARNFNVATQGFTVIIKITLLANSQGADRVWMAGGDTISVLLNAGNSVRFIVRNTSATIADLSSSSSLALNTIATIACRCSSGQATIWINGVQRAQAAYTSPADLTNLAPRMGSDTSGGISSQLSAHIHQVAVYNAALSDAQITNIS
jgi:hypothetical protein